MHRMRGKGWMGMVAAVALATALLPALGGADTAPGLRARAESLGRSEQGALLELYALESSLGRAQRQAENLRSSSTALAERAAAARRSAVIVRDSLALSHGRVATAVRRLYVEGDADPIAVLHRSTRLSRASSPSSARPTETGSSFPTSASS